VPPALRGEGRSGRRTSRSRLTRRGGFCGRSPPGIGPERPRLITLSHQRRPRSVRRRRPQPTLDRLIWSVWASIGSSGATASSPRRSFGAFGRSSSSIPFLHAAIHDCHGVRPPLGVTRISLPLWRAPGPLEVLGDGPAGGRPVTTVGMERISSPRTTRTRRPDHTAVPRWPATSPDAQPAARLGSVLSEIRWRSGEAAVRHRKTYWT